MKTVLLLIFTCFSVLPAQNGSVNGFVYDNSNKESLIGANVYLAEMSRGSSTNLSGYYVIPDLPAGEYTLICDYIGYHTITQKIKIEPGKSVRLNILMDTEQMISETIVVEAESIRTVEKLYRKPISKIELTPMQIKAIPQVAETDLLRSLQTLPGIVPLSDFSSALYVRGGTPDQNLYMIDGSDVYNPEHAFGLFSTFNTDAIKHVDISKGGFGAQYGGRLSSIMDVTYLDGNQEHFEGSFSVSLLSAKTTLQMPIGKIGSVSGSIRRTYFDKTVGAFIDEIPDYYFYDGNIKAFFNLDANNKLTISFFQGRDYLDLIFNEDSDSDAGFRINWGNTTGSIRYTRVFSPNLFANFWVTASRFSSYFNFSGGLDLSEKNYISDYTYKSNLEYAWSSSLSFNAGFEHKILRGVYKENFPSGKVDVDANRNHYVAFIQSTWKPEERWNIDAGLRFNYFDSEKDFKNLGPRMALKYRLTETTNLKLSGGLYHQYLHQIPRAFITSIWTSSDQYYEESSSTHIIAGFQKEIQQDFSFEAEAYYKTFKSILSFNQNAVVNIYPTEFTEDGKTVYGSTEGLFNTGNGESAGFELFLRKDTGPVTGWAGYTLADTRYKFSELNDGHSFNPRHHRSHVINLVSNMDIGWLYNELKNRPTAKRSSRWMFGLNFVYSSGQPLTVPSSTYFSNTTPDLYYGTPSSAGSIWQYSIYPTSINAYTLPAYARMDISLTWHKQYQNWSMEPFVQIFNVGNRENVWFITYDHEIENDRISQNVETVTMLPMLPTFGINIKF